MNKIIYNLTVLFTALSLGTTPSFAMPQPSILTFSALTHIHFSNSYYGEKVLSVKVDCGLETSFSDSDQKSGWWQDLHTGIELKKIDDEFATYIELSGSLVNDIGRNTVFYGVAVTYEIQLESGAAVKIENVHVPISSTYCHDENFAFKAFRAESCSIRESKSLIWSEDKDCQICIKQFIRNRS